MYEYFSAGYASYLKFRHNFLYGILYVQVWINLILVPFIMFGVKLSTSSYYVKPQTEIVPGIFLGVKVRPARKADNLTAICEPTV
jgi:hypothetical protein